MTSKVNAYPFSLDFTTQAGFQMTALSKSISQHRLIISGQSLLHVHVGCGYGGHLCGQCGTIWSFTGLRVELDSKNSFMYLPLPLLLYPISIMARLRLGLRVRLVRGAQSDQVVRRRRLERSAREFQSSGSVCLDEASCLGSSSFK